MAMRREHPNIGLPTTIGELVAWEPTTPIRVALPIPVATPPEKVRLILDAARNARLPNP